MKYSIRDTEQNIKNYPTFYALILADLVVSAKAGMKHVRFHHSPVVLQVVLGSKSKMFPGPWKE